MERMSLFRILILLLLLHLFCFLYHHHPASASASASAMESNSNVVEYLPGFQGPLPFTLETGYIGVDEGEDVQLFYYFIQSESNPKEDPLMFWITGGPGCSSITGILYEIGPIQFEAVDYNGTLPTLILRPYSWTKMASIIFVDVPVGTGFSYGRTERAAHSTDFQFFDQAYEFITKWFKNHPDFIANPFYVGGDSYSGIPVTVITQLISNGNGAGNHPFINLKGYVLGNPVTFPSEDNYEKRFANGMGLISDELYKSLFTSCKGEYRSRYIDPNNLECLANLEYYEECIDGIEKPHVLEPYCGSPFSPLKLPSERRIREHDHARLSAFYCRNDGYNLASYWADDTSVREALHIQKGSVGNWVRCKSDINFTTTLDDVRPYHLNLSMKGYRSLIYSGDHDMIVTHQSTQAWVRDLNYSVIDPWRSWKVNGQIAGYTEAYSNRMTFATVKGSGHTAPEYTPELCYPMFQRWISHKPL